MSDMFAMILTSLMRLPPLLLVTAGCVLYLLKTRGFVGALLLAGNLLIIVAMGISTFMTIAIASGTFDHGSISRYSAVTSSVSFLAGVVFGIGFLLMAINAKRTTPS